MTRETASEILQQIFMQAATDESYFNQLETSGIIMAEWPEMFTSAKAFKSLADEKTWLAAIVETQPRIPASFHTQAKLTIADTIAVHSEALDTLLGLELAAKIQKSPGKFRELVAESSGASQASKNFLRLGEVIFDSIDAIKTKIETEKTTTVLAGFEKLSNCIDGFEPGRVTIVTAPTGFGKTNLGISLFVAAAASKMQAVFVNMEMQIEDMGKRIMQVKAGLRRDEFRNANFFEKLIRENFSSWANDHSDCWVSDGRSLSLHEISKNIMAIKKQQPLQIALIDYDQKIESTGKDEEWKFLQKAVQDLEEMAKREYIHVILFSQANENGVPRASLRAMQPASSVIYFHKADGRFRLKFLKNRHGPTDRDLLMKYQPEKSIIEEDDFEILEPFEKPAATKPSKHFQPYRD